MASEPVTRRGEGRWRCQMLGCTIEVVLVVGIEVRDTGGNLIVRVCAKHADELESAGELLSCRYLGVVGTP